MSTIRGSNGCRALNGSGIPHALHQIIAPEIVTVKMSDSHTGTESQLFHRSRRTRQTLQWRRSVPHTASTKYTPGRKAQYATSPSPIRLFMDDCLPVAVVARRNILTVELVLRHLHGALGKSLSVLLRDCGNRRAHDTHEVAVNRGGLALGRGGKLLEHLSLYEQGVGARAALRIEDTRRDFRLLAVACEALRRLAHVNLVRANTHLAAPHEEMREGVVDHVALLGLDAARIAFVVVWIVRGANGSRLHAVSHHERPLLRVLRVRGIGVNLTLVRNQMIGLLQLVAALGGGDVHVEVNLSKNLREEELCPLVSFLIQVAGRVVAELGVAGDRAAVVGAIRKHSLPDAVFAVVVDGPEEDALVAVDDPTAPFNRTPASPDSGPRIHVAIKRRLVENPRMPVEHVAGRDAAHEVVLVERGADARKVGTEVRLGGEHLVVLIVDARGDV